MSMDDDKVIGNSDWLAEYNLALEDKVHCDTLECPNPATHYAQVRCCNAVIVGCDGCMSAMFMQLKWMVNTGKAIQCRVCKEKNNPAGWLSKPEII